MRRQPSSSLRLALILLALATLACNLTAARPTATFAPPTVLVPTITPLPIATPTPVISDWPDDSGNVICVPRTDWPLYTIVAGDTLGEIAERTNTTSETLAAANCLENANLISVGQPLYVPFIPAPPATNTPLPGGIPNEGVIDQAGQVMIAPYVGFDGSWYEVQPNVQLTLSWPEAEGARVEFFLAPTGTGSQGIVIGADGYLADGASVGWSVTPGMSGLLYARGYAGDGIIQTLGTVGFYTVDDAPAVVDLGYVSLTPYLSYNQTLYQLQAGTLVTLTWADARRDSARVVFYLRDLNQNGSPLVIIGVDETPSDGASFTWPVPSNAWGSLGATAYLPDGTEQHTVWEPYVQSGTP
ncbi:MAG: LysM peptidoglycan-binding domain-containing protein [Anaerolineae bacterium]|nr:LysM peptidoglycan-binding domain-containing protein [Anaerolineae bacterium]